MSTPIAARRSRITGSCGASPGGTGSATRWDLYVGIKLDAPVRAPGFVIGDREVAWPALNDEAGEAFEEPSDRVHVEPVRPGLARRNAVEGAEDHARPVDQ